MMNKNCITAREPQISNLRFRSFFQERERAFIRNSPIETDRPVKGLNFFLFGPSENLELF